MTNSVNIWRDLAECKVMSDENKIAIMPPDNLSDLTIMRILLLLKHKS